MENPNQLINRDGSARFGTEIRDIADALAGVHNNDIATLPERIFKEVYMPFFAGDGNPYGVDLNHYAGAVGGHNRRANVVNAAGEVIFSVPPIAERRAINSMYTGRDLPSIFHVILTSDQYSKISPADGEKYLENQLARRSFIMQNDEITLELLQEWDAIFQRYGYSTIVTPAVKQAIAEDAGTTVSEKGTNDAERNSLVDSWEPI